MGSRILSLIGVIVSVFLLGLYASSQFKFGHQIPTFDWVMPIGFMIFNSWRILTNE